MSIVKRGNTYHKRERQNGKDVQFALKTNSYEEAKKRDSDTAGLMGLPTVDDAIKRYRERPEAINKTDDIYLRKISRTIGKVPLADLSTDAIDKLLTKPRFAEGLKPGSIRRELNTLQAMLNHARMFGMTSNEFKLRKPRVDDARNRWLTRDQRDDMIEIAAPSAFKAFVAAGFYTGCRLGELMNAKASDYDKQACALTVSTGKTGGKGRAYRRVPIHPVVLDLLVPNDTWFLPSPSGKQWSKEELYRHWKALVRLCEIEDFKPHDMRHTFASLMVQAGVDLITIASITGHRSVTMLSRYSHLDTRTQTNAINNAL